jgi:site-specific DNA-methyltransferase (adenine-specific)
MGSYAAPTVGNKIHPSQKSEPMLRAFLSMLVDETSTVLDPCCGSAAALRAAEDCGAKSILGLELDPNYAQAALTRTLQARILRQAGTMVKDEVL